jgi:hypothetical protein
MLTRRETLIGTAALALTAAVPSALLPQEAGAVQVTSAKDLTDLMQNLVDGLRAMPHPPVGDDADSALLRAL